MRYFYYPGCSLEGTAAEYHHATLAVMGALGAELIEIEGWSCCGASAAEAMSYLLSLVLPARNLAMAEQMRIEADFAVPCSACYLNLRKVEDHVKRDDRLMDRINQALDAEGLQYTGSLRVRHLLDVIANDIKPERIGESVQHSLSGLRIAPYYGCQALRPYADFDDPQQPTSMAALIEALGASVHPWAMGAKCCGAGLMTTKKALAMEMVSALLKAAKGADCIVTICPMCQMNLESYQAKAARMSGEDLTISVLYLPQLIGLALGLPEDELKLKLNLAYTEPFQKKLASLRSSTVAA